MTTEEIRKKAEVWAVDFYDESNLPEEERSPEATGLAIVSAITGYLKCYQDLTHDGEPDGWCLFSPEGAVYEIPTGNLNISLDREIVTDFQAEQLSENHDWRIVPVRILKMEVEK